MNKQIYSIGTKVYFYHHEKWNNGEVIHVCSSTSYYIIGSKKAQFANNTSQQLTTVLKFFNYDQWTITTLREALLSYTKIRDLLTVYGFPFEKTDLCSIKEFYLNSLNYV